MKRRDLIRHIEAHGCVFVREGGNHAVYANPLRAKVSTIPRHREINDFLARKICSRFQTREPPTLACSGPAPEGIARVRGR